MSAVFPSVPPRGATRGVLSTRRPVAFHRAAAWHAPAAAIASARRRRGGSLGAAGLALVVAASCAKVTAPPPSGTGTGGFTLGPGPTGSGGGTGSGAGTGTLPPGSGGRGGLMSSTSDGGVCQQAEYTFVPKTPTVYLLVDRSGSMYHCIKGDQNANSCPDPLDTTWAKLKDGVLPVVQTLEASVRFGFSTLVGTNPRFMGGVCPIVDKVAPALSNYAAIAKLYNSLPPGPNTNESGKKFETPTELLLGMVGDELLKDTTPGQKYILFVTDGEPDYCGDGNALCAPDGVVGQIQKLSTAGVTTIVFGVAATSVQTLAPGVLQAFANAGAGEPTLAPLRGTNPKIEDFYDQCFNTGAPADDAAGGWTRSFLATGKPMMRGQTIGTYAPAAGPTKPFQPDVTDQQKLVDAISLALSGVKSCTFDLNNVNGQALKVNLALLAKAHVLIEGKEIPLDDTNGWKMTTQSELVLEGTACVSWRKPESAKIDFQFPCEIIAPE